LLDRSTNINANPAVECGVTTLQATAITRNIMLAELSTRIPLSRKVTLRSSALLNAGGRADITRGTGFRRAVELVEKNDQFAMANPSQEARGQDLV
ncbi:hypothetical protein C8A05DRAFT_20479, partial [Staphylotrichum tortipilum]